MVGLREWGQQDMMYHSVNRGTEEWTSMMWVGIFKFSIVRI